MSNPILAADLPSAALCLCLGPSEEASGSRIGRRRTGERPESLTLAASGPVEAEKGERHRDRTRRVKATLTK